VINSVFKSVINNKQSNYKNGKQNGRIHGQKCSSMNSANSSNPYVRNDTVPHFTWHAKWLCWSAYWTCWLL